jgi:hypothetical protein
MAEFEGKRRPRWIVAGRKGLVKPGGNSNKGREMGEQRQKLSHVRR